MSWVELHIKTTDAYADSLSDQLTLLGAQAVTFQDAGDQPIYEPTPGALKLWQETIVIGLFNYSSRMQPILDYLEEQQSSDLIHNFRLQYVEDREWERVCLEHFKPMHYGKRLWICPSWQTPPDPAAVNVTLDPGLAFGTGTHPTTSLCLEWLDENIHDQEEVLDYGCGSGILAIAALKLGAKQVIAVDNDPQALQATRQNAERNQITDTALKTLFPSEIKELKPNPNMIVANILAQPLIELAPYFASLLKSGSKIALSGILATQIEELRIVYNSWFDLPHAATRGEWARLTGTRK